MRVRYSDFRGLDSDFGSAIVEYGSVSGVRFLSKCATAVAEWVLVAMRRVGGAGELPSNKPGGQNMVNMSTVAWLATYHLEST